MRHVTPVFDFSRLVFQIVNSFRRSGCVAMDLPMSQDETESVQSGFNSQVSSPVGSPVGSPSRTVQINVEVRRVITHQTEIHSPTAALTLPSPPPRRRQVNQPSAERQLLEGAQDFLTGGSGRERKRETVVQLFGRAIISTPFYPIRYIHRLIQLGYEPVQPQRRFSFIFQRYMYYHPGVLGYARAIADNDGWKTLYRGMGVLLASDVVGLLTNAAIHPVIQSAINKIPMPFNSRDTGDVPDTDPAYRDTLPSILTRASRMFMGNVLANCAVQLVVHPFHVISMRTVAQYIGKESLYSSLWSSIKEIYNTQGLSGFYSGLVPALLGHLCTCVIHSSLWLMFEIIVANISYDMGKLVIKTFIAAPLLAYIPGSYSYPLFLMSNVMAVNNCGLAAGMPPRVPAFTGWRDCYSHLKSSGELYRGSVILFSRFAYKDPPSTEVHA